MSSDRRLEGKVALITGASSGIGLACAERFAREGAVVAGFDLNPCDSWEERVGAISKALFFQGDVRSLEAQEKAVQEVLEKHGKLDVVVMAAGIATGAPIHLMPEEEWDRVQDINVKGSFLTAKAVLPQMMKQRAGSIITIGSVEGIEGTEGGGAYNASKGGVVLLTKNIAMDYGPAGIRANCICPGFIETPLFDSVFGNELLQGVRENIRKQHKLGRFGNPVEVAGAAFFLASEDSSFVTGQNLVVDGGFTAGHAVGIADFLGIG